jgi:hypothetical protein
MKQQAIATHGMVGLIALFLLSACGGPLSVVPYVMGAGVAYKAGQEQEDYNHNKRYVARCLPIDRKRDPFSKGLESEVKKEWVEAYEYYSIALWGHDTRASTRLALVEKQMTPEQLTTAKHNITLFTAENLNSCYEQPFCPGCYLKPPPKEVPKDTVK